MLPDGDTVLLAAGKVTNGGLGRWDKAQIIAQSVATGARTLVIDGGSDARYLPSGHLAYTIDGTVYAVPFDLAHLKVTGEAVPILAGVRRAAASSTGMADFSRVGQRHPRLCARARDPVGWSGGRAVRLAAVG